MELIKFYKQQCPACDKVQNFIEGNEIEDKVTYVNPFEEPEKASTFDIGSVPTTILLDDTGEEINRVVGFKPDELEKLTDELD